MESEPWMRVTSSTRSAAPCRSGHHEGGVTYRTGTPAIVVAAEIAENAPVSAGGRSTRSAASPARIEGGHAATPGTAAPSLSTRSPPGQLRRQLNPARLKAGSTPRSEAIARVGIDTGLAPAAAVRTGSNNAASMKTLTVSIVQPVPARPSRPRCRAPAYLVGDDDDTAVQRSPSRPTRALAVG